MFGLGPMEIGLVFLIILLVFGAKRIPEIAHGIGKGITEFKKAARDVTDEFETGKEASAPVKNELRGQRIAEKPQPAAEVKSEIKSEVNQEKREG
jgi:sec-independent protein translocase protein TatA